MSKYNFTHTKTTLNQNNAKRQLTCLLTVFLFLLTTITWAQDKLVGLTSNGGPEGKGTAFSINTDATGFSVVKGFVDWGSDPNSDLVKGTDGNMYGMVPNGGTFGHGTIFKVTPTGTITVIKNFNLSVDGGIPKGSLIQATDGNFWGMTSTGSYNNGGCIFKITPDGTYKIVRSLNVNLDGGRAQGHLIQARDGNFYGMTNGGGAKGYGTFFRITMDSVFTVLKSFDTPIGVSPYGSPVQGIDGNFYGMTRLGGRYNRGVIFRLTADGTNYSVLHHFSGTGVDGQYPNGDLIQAKDGWFYGLTTSGGANYNGTIFKTKSDTTSFTTVRSLSAGVEGGNPQGSLMQTSDGSFYATAYSITGGFTGSVFKMTSGGVTSAIKKFTLATEGGYPMGSLVLGTDGQLYGMTNSGGRDGDGTVFKVNTSGVITVLNHFSGARQGNVPQDNLVLGKDSAYYGVATYGGVYDYGTVFKICGGVTTTLHSFNHNSDGGNPRGGIIKAIDGNLYGMTEVGGMYSGGTIYKINPSTGSFSVLRHLKGTTDGQGPRGNLLQGADSALFGITSNGGTGTGGTIFRITTGGSFSVLRHLVPTTDGNNAEAGLVLGSDGAFYGMTSTRFFRITKDGAFNVIRTLSYATDGNSPYGSLIRGTDGKFYGTFSSGGTWNAGVIFKIAQDGTLTKLRHLNGTTDGGTPKGGLLQAPDGNFYGTTSLGGTHKAGTIYRIKPDGTFEVLKHLDLAKDGGAPFGGLILAPKNTLIANSQRNLVTDEDNAKAIVLNGSGGTNFTYNIVIAPKNGTVTSGTTATRTYQPRANYSGKDSFAFNINIGCLASAPAWVTFNINPINDAPVLAAIGSKTAITGTVLTFRATATDVDAGQTKTFSLISAPVGATINAGTGTFTWTPSTANTYIFKVRVTDNGSPVLYDEEQIIVTVTNPSLTNSELRMAKVEPQLPLAKSSIYPNPVNDRFTLAIKKAGNCTIRIIDLKGTPIINRKYTRENNNLQIEAGQLHPGQYLLQIQMEGETETLKLIKL